MDVTLETSGRGRWGAEDIRATEPGVQVFVDKGEALVDYYPPALSGTHKIAVRNGLGRYEAEVKLLADDSKRIVAGVVEGVVRLPGSVEPATGLEGFDGVTTGVGGELYTYTVPAGVTRVKVRLVGGVGGTGDNFLRTPFSKGGAARIIDAIVNVVPGDTITGTVGSGGGVNGFSNNGGAGGSGTGRGGDGGDTTSITGGSPGGGGGGGTSLALGGTTVLKAGGGGGGEARPEPRPVRPLPIRKMAETPELPQRMPIAIVPVTAHLPPISAAVATAAAAAGAGADIPEAKPAADIPTTPRAAEPPRRAEAHATATKAACSSGLLPLP
ncbi:glycine-rich domain-containing protein [Sinorhizobium meliloti]